MADCGSLQLCFKLHTKECECDTVADSLQQAGIEAAAYHAGLGDSDRIHVQDRWLSGDNCKVGGCGPVPWQAVFRAEADCGTGMGNCQLIGRIQPVSGTRLPGSLQVLTSPYKVLIWL